MAGEPTDATKEILVVDDDEAFARIIVAVLRREGHRVTLAKNGRRALQVLALRNERPPNLVLLDLDMPVMDGGAFLDAYAAALSLPPVPIVVLSGNLAGHARRPGSVIVYLRKPVDLPLLLATVDLWAS